MINILIADDYDIARSSICRMLIDINPLLFNIEEAENGRVVIRKFKNKPYHILIMDVDMPKKNAFEVITEIDKEAIKQSIFIILVTGYTKNYIISRIKKLPNISFMKINAIIEKPVNIDELKEVIEKYCDNLLTGR